MSEDRKNRKQRQRLEELKRLFAGLGHSDIPGGRYGTQKQVLALVEELGLTDALLGNLEGSLDGEQFVRMVNCRVAELQASGRWPTTAVVQPASPAPAAGVEVHSEPPAEAPPPSSEPPPAAVEVRVEPAAGDVEPPAPEGTGGAAVAGVAVTVNINPPPAPSAPPAEPPIAAEPSVSPRVEPLSSPTPEPVSPSDGVPLLEKIFDESATGDEEDWDELLLRTEEGALADAAGEETASELEESAVEGGAPEASEEQAADAHEDAGAEDRGRGRGSRRPPRSLRRTTSLTPQKRQQLVVGIIVGGAAFLLVVFLTVAVLKMRSAEEIKIVKDQEIGELKVQIATIQAGRDTADAEKKTAEQQRIAAEAAKAKAEADATKAVDDHERKRLEDLRRVKPLSTIAADRAEDVAKRLGIAEPKTSSPEEIRLALQQKENERLRKEIEALKKQSPPASSPTPASAASPPPTAEAGSDRTVAVNDAVRFSGRRSKGNIVKYVWDFGDLSVPTEGRDVRHAYASLGTFTVTLAVTDDQGRTATDTLKVSVE